MAWMTPGSNKFLGKRGCALLQKLPAQHAKSSLRRCSRAAGDARWHAGPKWRFNRLAGLGWKRKRAPKGNPSLDKPPNPPVHYINVGGTSTISHSPDSEHVELDLELPAS